MKNKYKDLIIIAGCLMIFLYSIFNNKDICLAVSLGFYLWYKKAFPSLFPSILITNILINNNISYYWLKIFNKIGIKWYILLFSLMGGSVNSSLIIKDLYNHNVISLKDANKSLMFSFFNSPIFLISVLSFIFSPKYVILIIVCTYFSNFIICIFCKINFKNYNICNAKNNITIIINNTINILLSILGIICFFILISSIIINTFNLNIYSSVFLRGFLEITQGLNYLVKINNSFFKYLFALFFINFGGLSIHMQNKSILADTSISYKYFLIGRIICSIISIILFIILASILG